MYHLMVLYFAQGTPSVPVAGATGGRKSNGGRTKEISQRIKEAEDEKWRQAQVNKSSLLLYRQHKDTIALVPLYDNGLGSVLLFEARAGALRTLVRKQAYDGELVSVVCRACGRADETIAHIVTECPQLSPSSSNTNLAAALGFVDTGDVVDYAAVRRSKTRLEQWRKITLRGLRKGS
ncbi:hypothetical protein MRX96_031762 [Rhipicephalus microplus]